MNRHRPPHVAQGTWRSGALHVWGWNGVEVASMAWLYSGFRRVGADGERSGWHDSPISYGAIAKVAVPTPGRTLHAPSVQLDPLGTAVWLSELPSSDHLSPSLAWFARLAQLARRTVSTHRITPVVVDEGPFTVGRWAPIAHAATAEVLAELDAAMPPICVAGGTADATRIHEQLCDGLARSLLSTQGWRPDLGSRRTAEVQALRATFGALSKPDHVIRGGSRDFAGALERLRSQLERHRRRIDGEPVALPRLRLILPDDPLEPWEVRIELVDDRDPNRWCTADDVWERNPVALDVARDERFLPVLIDVISSTADRIKFLPGLGHLAFDHEPIGGELDLDVAEEFIDIAPAELAALGIELIGPESLLKVPVSLNGEATPAPADDRAKQFGREALVQWKLVVGDEQISDIELARAAEAGARLLHTGHRWVRIDADELRRKRRRLQELQEGKPRVTALELLQLANDDESTSDRPLITVRHDAADDDAAAALGIESHSERRNRERRNRLHGEATDEAPGEAPGDATGTLDGSAAPSPGTSAEDWVRQLLAGLPDDMLEETVESADFVGELRHYQRRGLGWMKFLAGLGLGGCLADDMGLGKTATTLAHLVDRPGPHLVVCPLSVVRNWRSEAARFTPKLEVRIHHGSDRALGVHGSDELFTADPTNLVVVTTYGLLARDLAELATVEWSTFVLDEAQMVKNPHTKAARAVRALSAHQKLALTGTPVENRLSELWAILDAVNPGLLGSLEKFRLRFGTPIEKNGDELAAARLRRLTRPFVLRRTKADKRLLPDLPDKIEQIAYAKLTREQATLYQQVVDQLLADAEQAKGMRRRGIVLAALMRLKQICNHPAHALRDGSRLAGRSGKLTRFDELVTELLDAGERALVFTQFREMGELLTQHVATQFGFTAPFLHGGSSRVARDRMVDAFQDGSGPPLLIISLKAGGTGLNLTAASQVIHYDRWWNPAVEDQATDRAWRIGQDRTVNVHKLVCEGTVEEKIGQVIDDKRKLAAAVIGTGEAWVSELSTDELRALVTLERDE